jgi:hypothetical protein
LNLSQLAKHAFAFIFSRTNYLRRNNTISPSPKDVIADCLYALLFPSAFSLLVSPEASSIISALGRQSSIMAEQQPSISSILAALGMSNQQC